MKISPIKFNFGSIKHNTTKNATPLNFSSSPMQDTFEKSTPPSFKASGSEKTSMLEGVLAVGGAAALLAIPTLSAIAFVKKQNPQDIFLPDGTYYGNVRDLQVDSHAAKQAGIDLSQDRFTFKDPINGVFKNPHKGVDINFTSGKYVDPENGIFIDKEQGISAVYNNGHFDPVAIPDVSFEGFYDPTCVSMPRRYVPTIPREQFIQDHDGLSPEEYYNFERPSEPLYGFTPIDRRSVMEKVKDWFNDTAPNKTDFWGREVYNVKDAVGNVHQVPVDDKLSDIIHSRHMSYEDVQHFITYQAEHPIAGYITKNLSENIAHFNLHPTGMDDFMAQAAAHHSSGLDDEISPYVPTGEDFEPNFEGADDDIPDFDEFDGLF